MESHSSGLGCGQKNREGGNVICLRGRAHLDYAGSGKFGICMRRGKRVDEMGHMSVGRWASWVWRNEAGRGRGRWASVAGHVPAGLGRGATRRSLSAWTHALPARGESQPECGGRWPTESGRCPDKAGVQPLWGGRLWGEQGCRGRCRCTLLAALVWAGFCGRFAGGWPSVAAACTRVRRVGCALRGMHPRRLGWPLTAFRMFAEISACAATRVLHSACLPCQPMNAIPRFFCPCPPPHPACIYSSPPAPDCFRPSLHFLSVPD
ncbi:hypothetical protein L227DRAFT_18732 [Lentinus tigrinus ALCF2SS1-6]|uniref:Uncharacterized protein n=1 Tax=Lentinus tigrinus ALCF2SS1-6 TaxID=1328759 RepID=A0A5C2T5T8_9APHY|nr:hypothetical protein L227DRAFT_18732 [Lentinus tigrinus ALCF2SS1-6]